MDNKKAENQEELDQAGSDLLLSVTRIVAAEDRHDDELRTDVSAGE